jgi:L-asparagine transporter-like permease
MMSISVYGACFTWLMIFVTHLFFRRQHRQTHLKFRMWGFPYTTLAGAGLMAALLISTAFTEFFRMTLWVWHSVYPAVGGYLLLLQPSSARARGNGNTERGVNRFTENVNMWLW